MADSLPSRPRRGGDRSVHSTLLASRAGTMPLIRLLRALWFRTGTCPPPWDGEAAQRQHGESERAGDNHRSPAGRVPFDRAVGETCGPMTNSTCPSASIRCRVRCCLAPGSRRPSAIAAASPGGRFIKKMPRASGVLHQDTAEHRPGSQRHPACPAPDARRREPDATQAAPVTELTGSATTAILPAA
jgi:hypothetical protein